MKYLKKIFVIMILGLVLAFPNLEGLRDNKVKMVGDYGIVFIKNDLTGQHYVYVFEFKENCVGAFIKPTDGGTGCWELVGRPDIKILELLDKEPTGNFK